MPSSRDIIRQWFDCIARGDAPAAFALFAPDVVYVLKGTTPVSGTYRGMKEIVDDFFAPWSKQVKGHITLVADDIIGEGERIVALARGTATTIHDLPYDNDYAFVFRVRDGKITEVIEYLDTALVETAAYGKKIV